MGFFFRSQKVKRPKFIWWTWEFLHLKIFQITNSGNFNTLNLLYYQLSLLNSEAWNKVKFFEWTFSINSDHFNDVHFPKSITRNFFNSYIFSSHWLGKVFCTKFSWVTNSDIFRWSNHLKLLIPYYIEAQLINISSTVIEGKKFSSYHRKMTS